MGIGAPPRELTTGIVTPELIGVLGVGGTLLLIVLGIWRDLRGDIRDLRGEMRDLRGEIHNVRGEMRTEIRQLFEQMDTVEQRLSDRTNAIELRIGEFDVRLTMVKREALQLQGPHGLATSGEQPVP